MVPHEYVAEVIDRLIVDREEVPRLVVQQPDRRGVYAHRFRQSPQECGQTLVDLLIDLLRQRYKRLDYVGRQNVRMHAQTGQHPGQFRRMNRVRRERPAVVKRPAGALIMVGNHHAVDRFRRMTGPPADHDAAQTALVEDVPKRFRFSRKVGDRAHTTSVWRWLGEAMDSVLERPLSGTDGSPEHGRKG